MVIVLLLFAFVMSLIKEFTEKVIGHNEPDHQTDEVVENDFKEAE
jgi:hypothetical protein